VTNDIIRQFCRRVKYSDKEIEKYAIPVNTVEKYRNMVRERGLI